MNHHPSQLDHGVSADVETQSAFQVVLATLLLAFLLQVFWRCCCLCYRKLVKHVKNFLSFASSSAACDMEPTEIALVENILNYRFKNKNLLVEALTHSSFSGNMSYERLEFIGDAALGLAVANQFFCLKQKLTQGQMTKLRENTVKNEKLARVAAEHGLYWFVLRKNTDPLDRDVEKYEEAVKKGGDQKIEVKNPDILADIVESLAGAVYLDLNSDLSKLWLIFKEILRVDEIELPKDEGDGSSEITGAQNDLYRLCNRRKWKTKIPNYSLVKEEGSANDKKYVCSVEIEIGDHVITKTGDEKSTQKDARNSAAYHLIRYLQESGII